VRVDPPEQEVHATGDGRYELTFRARLPIEDDNAAMSLATNMAVAEALHAAGTGLFRVMDEPDARAVARLRHTAHGLGVHWAADESLEQLERRLDPADHRHAAMMVAVRRAGGGARYEASRPGAPPRHAAVAATYAHATAPLRRLADRYVVEAAVAVAAGRAVPEPVAAAFAGLPEAMGRADQRAGQVERAVIELAEAAALHGQERRTFAATVTDTDDRGARVQLADLPVVTRVEARGVEPGDDVRVKLIAVDVVARTASFARVA
jgi:exoribonuclease R